MGSSSLPAINVSTSASISMKMMEGKHHIDKFTRNSNQIIKMFGAKSGIGNHQTPLEPNVLIQKTNP